MLTCRVHALCASPLICFRNPTSLLAPHSLWIDLYGFGALFTINWRLDMILRVLLAFASIFVASTAIASASNANSYLCTNDYGRAMRDLYLIPQFDTASYGCCHFSIDNGTSCPVTICVDYLVFNSSATPPWEAKTDCFLGAPNTQTPGNISSNLQSGCVVERFVIKDKNGNDHEISQEIGPTHCISVQISQNCNAGVCMAKDVNGCPVITITPAPGCSC